MSAWLKKAVSCGYLHGGKAHTSSVLPSSSWWEKEVNFEYERR